MQRLNFDIIFRKRNENMNEIILCKYGEIVLKGANRKFFESMLNREVKRRMYLYGPCEVRASQSTITVDPKTDTFDIDGAYDEVKKIFGLVGVSRALKVEKDMEAIRAALRRSTRPSRSRQSAPIRRFP